MQYTSSIRFEAIETGNQGTGILLDNIFLQAKDCSIPPTCSQSITANYNCQGCVGTLNFNSVESSNAIYKAANKITSTAIINANVSYQAGECILLDEGFTTIQNFDFDAQIGVCN